MRGDDELVVREEAARLNQAEFAAWLDRRSRQ
jgi:hypothetical protein